APQFRAGSRLHPVLVFGLLVLHRARSDQAALHPPGPAATLSRLGIPDFAAGFPARDRFHDVLSLDEPAAGVGARFIDHGFRPADLRRFPQANWQRPRGRIFGSRMKLFRSFTAVLLAVALIWAATGIARAAEVTVDDTAKFLAGMPPSADSPLMPLTKDPSWQRHARFFDNAFGQLEQRQLSRIRTWSESHLAAPKPTMFYMFSGPDFLYANAFYPKATTYVLAALEPPGQVPDLTKVPRGTMAAALYNVEHSLGSILSFSFFITKQMKTDLRAGQIGGTLPILYVFLARSGKTIKSVTPIALDAEGQVKTGNENPGPNAPR